MTAFDRAWDIVKENDDYSKFGEKFAEKMKKLKEGGRGLPEGTKFSDLRSTSDIYSGAGSEPDEMKDRRPEMPEGVPINIFDLKDYRPSDVEIENNRIVDEIMGRKMRFPQSLIDRAKAKGLPPKDDYTPPKDE